MMPFQSEFTRRAALCGALGLLLAGCGPNNPTGTGSFVDEPGLSELSSMLRAFNKLNQRSPKNLKEIVPMEQGYPVAIGALKSGELVITWGAPIVKEGDGARTVLAYYKAVPDQGGSVLMQDGTTIQKLTADEFKAAPKATGG
jgi:hypothetical protein